MLHVCVFCGKCINSNISQRNILYVYRSRMCADDECTVYLLSFVDWMAVIETNIKYIFMHTRLDYVIFVHYTCAERPGTKWVRFKSRSCLCNLGSSSIKQHRPFIVERNWFLKRVIQRDDHRRQHLIVTSEFFTWRKFWYQLWNYNVIQISPFLFPDNLGWRICIIIPLRAAPGKISNGLEVSTDTWFVQMKFLLNTVFCNIEDEL